MKYKNSLVILVLFFSYISMFSQKSEHDIVWEDFEIESRYDPKLVTYEVNESGEYVILKKEPIKGPGGWQYFLEIRDENLVKLNIKDISSLIESERYLISNIIINDNNIVIFSYLNDNEALIERFYYQKIDINSLEVSKRKEIHKVEYKGRYSSPDVYIKQSLHNGNFQITFISRSERQRNVKYLLFDKNLETIWDFDLEDLGDEFIESYTYSNSVGNENDMVSLDKRDGVYSLLWVNERGVHSEEINLGTINPIDLNLIITKDNRILISGFYKDKDTYGMKGVYLWEVDSKSFKIKESVTSAYGKELLEYSESTIPVKKKKKKKKKKGKIEIDYGVSNVSIEKMLIDENNNYYIIGTQYKRVEHMRSSTNSGISYYYTYHYEDIYVTKFDSKFQHVYNVKIPKNTVLKKEKDTFSYILQNGELSFVFIDNKENIKSNILETEGTKIQGGYAENVIGISTIDSSGTVSRESLYDYYDQGISKFILHKTLNHNNEILFLGYFGKKNFKIGLLN